MIVRKLIYYLIFDPKNSKHESLYKHKFTSPFKSQNQEKDDSYRLWLTFELFITPSALLTINVGHRISGETKIIFIKTLSEEEIIFFKMISSEKTLPVLQWFQWV